MIKRLIVLILVIAVSTTWAKRKLSSYNVDVYERDPFSRGVSAEEQPGSKSFEEKLRKVITIKGVVVVGGKTKGIFNTGMYEVGDKFKALIGRTPITVIVRKLDIGAISAVIEVCGKKYTIREVIK